MTQIKKEAERNDAEWGGKRWQKQVRILILTLISSTYARSEFSNSAMERAVHTEDVASGGAGESAGTGTGTGTGSGEHGGVEAKEPNLFVALERLIEAAIVHAAKQNAHDAAHLRSSLRMSCAQILRRFAQTLHADCTFKNPAPLPHVARAGGAGHSAPYIIEHALRELKTHVSEALKTLRDGSAPPSPPSNAHWKRRRPGHEADLGADGVATGHAVESEECVRQVIF
jgi:hypothetical protein